MYLTGTFRLYGFQLTASLLLTAAMLTAQPAKTRPAFDAAEITVNTSGSSDRSSHGTAGQLIMNNQTLKNLIERAWNLKPFQVTGPDWLESVRFNIAAKYPPAASNSDRSTMLRTLLEDRLKISVHQEVKDLSGYALVVAKRGSFKLKPGEPGGQDTSSSGGVVRKLVAKKNSMANIAAFAASDTGEVVVDRTGIEGVYDFELEWSTVPLASGDGIADPTPPLFRAIESSLGLRLQPQKVPVEVLVVDHAERVPVE